MEKGDVEVIKTNDQEMNDDYGYEETDYYYRKHTKHDAGATKVNKYIRISEVTGETEAPTEPEKVECPNYKKYDKDLADIQVQIDKQEKNIEEIREKIHKERTGTDPETNQLHEDLKKINEQLSTMKIEIDKKEKSSKQLLDELKRLREEREKLNKDVDGTNFKRSENRILEIINLLGFGTLSANEEKKLMEEKSKLEINIPKCKRIEVLKAKIKDLNEKNEAPLSELKELRQKRKELFDQKDKIKQTIDSKKEKFKENKQAIEELKLTKTRAVEIKKELEDKYFQLEGEYNDKIRKHEKYLKEIEYINKIKKKIADIKKRDEKAKKKADKEAKENTATVEINVVQANESVEEVVCKGLITYFKSLLPKEESSKKEEVSANLASKLINDQLKSGKLQLVSRDDESQVIGIDGGKEKKKNKGPKISKRERQMLESDVLILDINTLNDISRVGLNAPSKKNDVENFLKTLNERYEVLKKNFQQSKEKTEVK